MRRYVLDLKIEGDTIEAVRDALLTAANDVETKDWYDNKIVLFGGDNSSFIHGDLIDSEPEEDRSIFNGDSYWDQGL